MGFVGIVDAQQKIKGNLKRFNILKRISEIDAQRLKVRREKRKLKRKVETVSPLEQITGNINLPLSVTN